MFKDMPLLKKISLFSLISILYVGIASPQSKIQISDRDKETQQIDITISIDKGDFVYKDYIDISIDNPDVEITDWHSDQNSVDYFSKEFRETKKIYNTDFTMSCNLLNNSGCDISNSNIHVAYYLHSKKGLVEEVLPLGQRQNKCKCNDCIETNIDTGVKAKKPDTKNKKEKQTWSAYISDLVKTTDSIWIKILLSLLLGILLSLTPCIYPMIPITVGILQAQGSKSVFYNFFLALTYTVGISITFAALGLIAAFTGQLFGSILANPLFVIVLVLILIYLAFSMFGFYEIYIPKFLQQREGVSAKGTILSTFLFGVVSGTIASPCVSPGLVLLLSIVIAIGSKAIGFIMLFAFGLGLGFPLLLVGTFSGSINKLPKAGAWMIEIKKIFGIMMFGVCFYFLGNILPWYVILWMISLFSLLTGTYYLFGVKPYDTRPWKIYKALLGTAFCAASIFFATQAYKEIYIAQITKEDTFWAKEYKTALAQAKKENKALFIDFWATWCSSCKAIDKKLFTDPNVKDLFSKKFINVKIDGSNPQDTQFVSLKKKFNVIGVPVFLLIDPHTEKIIKRWTTQFYELTNQEIIKQIQEL